jgi:hypothetical protein
MKLSRRVLWGVRRNRKPVMGQRDRPWPLLRVRRGWQRLLERRMRCWSLGLLGRVVMLRRVVARSALAS